MQNELNFNFTHHPDLPSDSRFAQTAGAESNHDQAGPSRKAHGAWFSLD